MQQITYYQLPNQVTCTLGAHGFAQDYPNSTVPSPHSGYPCCCFNWHAGWPKFVSGMWAATPDGGLATIAYGPNRVSTTVAGNVPVTITQTTDYPFKQTISLRIDLPHPATFPLVLRIPCWTTYPSIKINGQQTDAGEPSTFQRIVREWHNGDQVDLRFAMPIRPSTWINNSVGFTMGPLAFSLNIKEQWRTTHDYPRIR